MTARERLELVAAVTSAHRPRTVDGAARAHPAWHDLDEAGRREAFEGALAQRAIEAALDEEGLSTTARAVLATIARGR